MARIESSADKLQPLPAPVDIADSTVPRWLYRAPLGFPVVPDVKQSRQAVRSSNTGQAKSGSPESIRSS
jgi:hypothetical protein